MFRRCFLAAAVVLLVSAGMASAQQKVGQIKAVGEAVVYVMPDTAEVSFSVQAEDKTLSVARQHGAVTMDAALAAVRALKIEELTIKTESIRAMPLYEMPKGTNTGGGIPGGYNPEDLQRKVVAYRVSNTATVTIRGDSEKLKVACSQVVDAALTAGVDSLQGPRFSKADTSAARLEALEKATKNAVDNIQAVARGLGVSGVRYTYVSLYGPDVPSAEDWREMVMGMGTIGHLSDGGGPPQAESPVEIEQIPISVAVWANGEYTLPGG